MKKLLSSISVIILLSVLVPISSIAFEFPGNTSPTVQYNTEKLYAELAAAFPEASILRDHAFGIASVFEEAASQNKISDIEIERGQGSGEPNREFNLTVTDEIGSVYFLFGQVDREFGGAGVSLIWNQYDETLYNFWGGTPPPRPPIPPEPAGADTSPVIRQNTELLYEALITAWQEAFDRNILYLPEDGSPTKDGILEDVELIARVIGMKGFVDAQVEIGDWWSSRYSITLTTEDGNQYFLGYAEVAAITYIAGEGVLWSWHQGPSVPPEPAGETQQPIHPPDTGEGRLAILFAVLFMVSLAAAGLVTRDKIVRARH